jgi:hypothetical protein
LTLFAGQVLNGLRRGVMLFPMAAGLALSTPALVHRHLGVRSA